MIKLFTPYKYYDPAQYETWLEDLALKGYAPEKITQFSSIIMHLKKGTPKKYKYVVDLQAFPKDGYVAVYESFGWELVGRMASMYIWRKEFTDQKPEAFSDRESLMKRNLRIARAISFASVLSFSVSIILWIGIAFVRTEKDSSELFSMGMLGGLTLLFGISLCCLSFRINRSRRD